MKRLLNSSRLSEFAKLCERVQRCRLCPRMADSSRILSHSSGRLDAKLLFIGEAPGRLGADSSGIPFHGDKAGENFESLLDFVGISREDIFVTNGVLCNPRDEKGNNSTPRPDELANCSTFLREQIQLVDPGLVVTLGALALRATSLIEPHRLNLRQHVRSSQRWFGRQLIPLYHPGQRAMIHRSLTNQRSDYQFVAEQLKRMGVKPRVVRGRTADSVAEVVKIILWRRGEVSYFALHKLLYLLEWAFMKAYGSRLTGAYFIRQKDGPYCTDLHLNKLRNSIPDVQMRRCGNSILLRLIESDLFSSDQVQRITAEVEGFVSAQLQKHRDKSDSQLKTSVYLTEPMRAILREERGRSANLYNTPLLMGW